MMAWALVLATVAPPTVQDKPTIVVAGLAADGFESHLREILLSDLRVAVGHSKAYVMVTPEAMGDIDEELKRQLSGGCDQASCIANLAKFSEARFVVTGRLVRLGERLQVTLKQLDSKNMAVVSTAKRIADDIEGIQDRMPVLVQTLLREKAVKATLRVIALFSDSTRADEVNLSWKGKSLGVSPFHGEVESGPGKLVAERYGQRFEITLNLRAGKRRATVVRCGENPARQRTESRLFAVILGVGGGVSGVWPIVMRARASRRCTGSLGLQMDY
jgi:hypothetical protein